MIVQRLDHFESRQHAIDAVEFAAGRLRVQVAARHDHRQGIIAAGAAREQIADGIDPDLAAGGFCPFFEQPPPRHIGIAQGLPIASAARRRANFCHFHQPRP